jgi:hypothetical protein
MHFMSGTNLWQRRSNEPNNALNTDRPNATAFGFAPRVRGAGGLA